MSSDIYRNAQQGQMGRVFPDILANRQLLIDLVWKDIRVRYRYAAMGFLWAVLEPLLMMLILTFVFSFVFQIEFRSSEGVMTARESAVFILSGLIAWQFFSIGVSTATTSLVDNRTLISKVNFPREIIPISSIGVALVNLVTGALLLIIIYVVLIGSIPPLTTLLIPILFVFQCLLVVGLGLFFSCHNAQFRDITYMVNALLLFGFYATPVIYSANFVLARLTDRGLEHLYPLLFINPMAGYITSYRALLFEGEVPSLNLVAWPIICTIIVFFLGLKVFRSQSPTISDKL
ncbi:MAG TPA: ABC transporter permease [Candidatus Hydrogenedentes bacterium]|nr:ABC transporter permease [Candidatus Hydrogenedentota bacterium]